MPMPMPGERGRLPHNARRVATEPALSRDRKLKHSSLSRSTLLRVISLSIHTALIFYSSPFVAAFAPSVTALVLCSEQMSVLFCCRSTPISECISQARRVDNNSLICGVRVCLLLLLLPGVAAKPGARLLPPIHSCTIMFPKIDPSS